MLVAEMRASRAYYDAADYTITSGSPAFLAGSPVGIVPLLEASPLSQDIPIIAHRIASEINPCF